VEASLRAKNQLDSSSRFDKMPACDRRTDGHTTTAYNALATRRTVKIVVFPVEPVEHSALISVPVAISQAMKDTGLAHRVVCP